MNDIYHNILEIRAGSHSYGTNIDSSDIDRRGIFCLPAQEVITGYGYVGEIEGKEPDDYRLFELKKFTTLLGNQNPNIMELLWTSGEDVLKVTEAGLHLQSFKEALLSKEVANTYVNYAISQIRRIKGHNKMINKPQPKEAPQIKDFAKIRYNLTDIAQYNKELPDSGFVFYPSSNDLWLAFSVEKLKQVIPGINPATNLFDKTGAPRQRERHEFDKLKALGIKPDILIEIPMSLYKAAMDEWKTYWSWVKDRNPTRSVLEVKYGFDTKHAMHTIRLLRTGLEILKSSTVMVRRPDAQELISIRQGAWSYEKVLAEASSMEERIKSEMDKSTLPETVDKALIASLTYEVYQKAWHEMKNTPTIAVPGNFNIKA